VLPVNDAINNTHWGDECQVKANHCFRLYVQNVNGLPLDRRGGQFDALCKVQKETQADVLLAQVHNLDSTQFQGTSILHATSKQHWDRYRLNIASTPISFKSMYKPGGTLMLTVGNATGRVLSQTNDKWGRWVSQTFQGTAGRTITIVSAYQVVTDVARPGTTTVATQQYSLLVHEQDSTNAPRTAFRRDLKTYLQQCRHRGEELILVGDFNEAIGEEADGMISLVQGLGLIDLMGARHNTSLPTTYARGRRCIDYGFATENVRAALEKCGYESFSHRFHSDHRAYFFDFKIRRLFGTNIQPLSKFEPRLLYSTNAKTVTRYLRKMHSIMTSCNAYNRGDRLEKSGRRDAFSERLDSDVLNGSLVSERALPAFPEPEWSQTLATARTQVAVLQKIMSCLRHAKPCPQLVRDQFRKSCPEWTHPQNKVSCKNLLNIAIEKVKAVVKNSFAQRDSEFRDRIETLE
jgi:exonuclease III